MRYVPARSRIRRTFARAAGWAVAGADDGGGSRSSGERRFLNSASKTNRHRLRRTRAVVRSPDRAADSTEDRLRRRVEPRPSRRVRERAESKTCRPETSSNTRRCALRRLDVGGLARILPGSRNGPCGCGPEARVVAHRFRRVHYVSRWHRVLIRWLAANTSPKPLGADRLPAGCGRLWSAAHRSCFGHSLRWRSPGRLVWY